MQYAIYRHSAGVVAGDAYGLHPDLIIDALIGYGLRGAPQGRIPELIRWANGTGAPILALDVPSGIDATSGAAPGDAISAAWTITLALPKTGLRVPNTGQLFLADIGNSGGDLAPCRSRVSEPVSRSIHHRTAWESGMSAISGSRGSSKMAGSPVHADVLLIIADISGYTRFMVANQTEIEHSHEIISALLEAIIGEVEIPLTVSKLEGDAVFLYAIKDAGIMVRVRESLGRFFTAFSQRLSELVTSRTCRCGACRNIDQLRLKLIVHSGRAVVVPIAGRTELAGVDVIIVHRLLKNSFRSNEYIALTEAAARDLKLDLPVLGLATERYDEIGSVNVIAYKPAAVHD